MGAPKSLNLDPVPRLSPDSHLTTHLDPLFVMDPSNGKPARHLPTYTCHSEYTAELVGKEAAVANFPIN